MVERSASTALERTSKPSRPPTRSSGTTSPPKRSKTCVDLGGTITIPAIAKLTVLANGFVDRNNVLATSTADAVIVTGLAAASGRVRILIREGTIEGDNFDPNKHFRFNAQFQIDGQIVFKNPDRVDIVNRSQKDLRIDNLRIEPIPVSPDVLVATGIPELDEQFTEILQAPGKVQWIFDPNVVVDVQGRTDADVLLNGSLHNPGGPVTITNLQGDVLAMSADARIEARDLVLLAKQGRIGSEEHRVRAQLTEDANRTPLSTASLGSTYLELAGFVAEADQAVFHVGELTAGEDLDVVIREDAALAGPTLFQFDLLSAGGNVVLRADRAKFRGTTDLQAEGKIVATTEGRIQIDEAVGDLRVGAIRSAAGDVKLNAGDGGIVDASEDESPNVQGQLVTLRAPAGGIGAADDALDVQVETLDASARNSI